VFDGESRHFELRAILGFMYNEAQRFALVLGVLSAMIRLSGYETHVLVELGVSWEPLQIMRMICQKPSDYIARKVFVEQMVS